MSELVERLKRTRHEIGARAAWFAVREAVTAEQINARADALAERQPGITESINDLERVLMSSDTGTMQTVLLGEDEDGAHITAVPTRVGDSLRGFDFKAIDPTTQVAMTIDSTWFGLTRIRTDESLVELIIQDGKARWQGGRAARSSTLIQPDLGVLEAGETTYRLVEDVVSQIWQKVHDPILNPELAAKAVALSQA